MMKLRKFYPSQVLRRLNGKHVGDLDLANQHALNIGLHRSRRAALAITICSEQIDVRNADELGRMMLGDLRSEMPVFHLNEGDVGHAPFEKRVQAMHDISAQSAEGKFAINTFDECMHLGLFMNNPVALCRQMVVDLADKQHGKEFSSKATIAVDSLIERFDALRAERWNRP